MKKLTNRLKCLNCGRKLKPDYGSVIYGTKKWDGHTYLPCKFCNKEQKNVRIIIG